MHIFTGSTIKKKKIPSLFTFCSLASPLCPLPKNLPKRCQFFMRNISTRKLNVGYYSLRVTGSSPQISLTTTKNVPCSHGKEKGEGEDCLRKTFPKPIVKSIWKGCLHCNVKHRSSHNCSRQISRMAFQTTRCDQIDSFNHMEAESWGLQERFKLGI